MTVRRVSLLLSVAVLVGPWHAAAQDGGVPDGGTPPRAECPPDHVGCHRADVDFHHDDALFDAVMLDSGWVPAGSPLQVRFAVLLNGATEVDLGGTVVTSWPPALDVAVPGRPGTGRLAMAYGLEIIARIRFDVSVAGTRYTWEGDIPIPGGIPRDLRLADEAIFDPFVLPPSEPRPIPIRDDTDTVRVLNVDITDALIPVPGIGGGFSVDAVASLEGSYRTDSIEVSDAVAPIEMENASTTIRPDPGAPEFGAAKDLTVLPHGTIGYDGVITLFPTLFLEIAGRRFDLTLAEVPLNVVDRTSETAFEAAEVHVPLPDVRVEPAALELGEVPVGGAMERLLTVHNEGEAELVVSARDPRAPFATGAPGLTVPPSSSARLAVRFAPTEAGDASGVLLLETNDPDEPLVTVRLAGTGAGLPAGALDAGVADGGLGAPIDGGCGCRAAPVRSSAPVWALGLLALLVRARRRR